MSANKTPVRPALPLRSDINPSSQPKAVDLDELRAAREKESAAKELDGRKRY